MRTGLDEMGRNTFAKRKRYDGRDVALMVYALRSSSSSDELTRSVIAALASLIERIVAADYDSAKKGEPVMEIRAVDAAACVFGLQQCRSEVPEVQALIRAMSPLIYQAQGRLDSKGIFLVFNGMQGLNSKDPSVKMLLRALEPTISSSEKYFDGFRDFYQLSGAISGLSRMSLREPCAEKLIEILSRLVTKTVKKAMPSDSERQVSQDGIEIEGGKRGDTKSGKEARQHFQLLARATPDRVGIALYGLQGLNHQKAPVEAILSALIPYVDRLSQLDGKTVGMCFQGFKSAHGAPSATQARMLSILSSKMSGWSIRGHHGNVKTVAAAGRFLREAQITLRSALVGIKNLDCSNPVVSSLLVNFANEILLWSDAVEILEKDSVNTGKKRDIFDKSTIRVLAEIFTKPQISFHPKVSEMLELVGIDYIITPHPRKLIRSDHNKRNPKHSETFENILSQ